MCPFHKDIMRFCWFCYLSSDVREFAVFAYLPPFLDNLEVKYSDVCVLTSSEPSPHFAVVMSFKVFKIIFRPSGFNTLESLLLFIFSYMHAFQFDCCCMNSFT